MKNINHFLRPQHATIKRRTSTFYNTFVSINVLFAIILFMGCSSDDDPDPEPPANPSASFSANIPDQNANMPSGGVIISQYSDSPEGFDIGKIADNDVKTKFITSKSRFYIRWEGDQDAAVYSYSLTSADDAPEKDPKAWTLFGSNDKQKWTAIDVQRNQTFSARNEKKSYTTVNKTVYKYYRLDIESNNGGKFTQIAEWTLELLTDPLIPHSIAVDEKNNNMPSTGTITSQYSDYPQGSDIGKIVDGNNNTKFVTDHSEFYILWEADKEAAVNYYTITSAENSPEKDPKSWTLSGSNDQTEWVLLDTQEDQTFSQRKETQIFQFENKTSYTYYQLKINNNNGGKSTQIAEWTMEEVPTDIEDLMRYADGHSYNPNTPMGNHYDNRHVTTDEDREWLKNPANEPPRDASAPDLYFSEFPVTLYPYIDPIPADVNQHAIGDCGGLAALASMAYITPDFIKSIIKDNGDKTFTISMFDPQGNPVEVALSSTFLTNNGEHIQAVSGKNNVATWATVLEKAIMKWNYIYKANEHLGGIGSEHVPPLFTGNGSSFAFAPGKLTAKQLARVVRICLTEGKYIVGGFNRGGLPIGNDETVTAHAYTLMHSQSKSALFSMRNPWGGGAQDGVLDIPDNGQIAPTIDLRIIDMGIAAKGITTPYIPPTFTAQEMKMRVADYLLNPGIQHNLK